jgi:very-short-patch-repair endonuclease
MLPKKCKHCGIEFVPQWNGIVYCPTKCYHESRVVEHEPLLCKHCGKPLDGVQLKRGRTYCCRACFIADKNIEKVCPICGKRFQVPVSIQDRYNVCSMECRLAYTQYIPCERCGKVFRAEKKLNRHYCSEECRRPPMMVVCRCCGRKFRTVPSNDQQFCSFACYRRFTGENRLEKTVRQALDSMAIQYIQEHRIGRYSIDFFLPQWNIALEIDGDYWHQDKTRDNRKDEYLKRHSLVVCRMLQSEIENSINLVSLLQERIYPAQDPTNVIQLALIDLPLLDTKDPR